MLIRHVTVAHCALALWTDERWIGQDQATYQRRVLTCNDSRNKTAHRVSNQGGWRNPEAID